MSVKILYLCGDMALIGGIEKYNSDFIAALRLTDLDICVVQRRVGGIASKIQFLLKATREILFFNPIM